MTSLTTTEIILIVITVVLGVIVVCGLIYLFFFHRTKNVKNIESVVNGASATQYFEGLTVPQKESFFKNPETGFGGFLEPSNKQNDFENFVKNRGNANLEQTNNESNNNDFKNFVKNRGTANLEQPNNESNNNDFKNFTSRKYGTKFV